MNKDYLQNIRYKLQKRVRSLKSTNQRMYYFALSRFWNFLMEQELIRSILIDLEKRHPEVSNDADVYCNVNNQNYNVPETELENSALCYFIIKKLMFLDYSDCENLIPKIGFKFIREIDFEKGFTAFNDYVVDSLYEYIDENIDDQRAILNYIVRYKHKCEWFKSKELFSIWNNNLNKGEHFLQRDLYEYLFDQGIDLYIEPTSASGEIDLIENQQNDNRLLAEVKIFNPEKSRGKNYIAKGFRQLYDYTLNYNESFGYLIIFKTCDIDLSFSLKTEDRFINYINHNNKIIFFVMIDIFDYEKSASKRGKLKTEVVTEDYLIEHIANENDN